MNTFKVVVLGQGGVGKSAFSIQFVQGQFIAEYDPTIEDSYRKQVTHEGRQVMLEILDTAGTEQFKCMRDLYMKSGDGFFLVYSIMSESTFLALKEIKEKISRVKDYEDVPTVMIGNKVDLESERQVQLKDAKQQATEWKCSLFETSAKTRKNVDAAFMDLISQMEKKKGISSAKEGGRRCTLF
eukprot:TRINITY_DN4491_c0_g1_i1.p1 TRINITY_DN4491_c0_g1~~TRINITY_DN4491_c0_g1_i1.p1  ORF type:complete len:184 (+),score=42.16 TRINITY_DN4491_c0_g1_i1:80-631(+)